MRTISQLVATVFASMIAAVIGLWVARSIVPAEVLRANNDVAGNYLQSPQVIKPGAGDVRIPVKVQVGQVRQVFEVNEVRVVELAAA